MNWALLAGIAGGGALGALARYSLAGLVNRIARSPLPWGTFVVNVAGALLIGLLWSLSDRAALGPTARATLMTGMLGAFTTFSTFSLETFHLLADRQYLPAEGYLLGSCILALAACFAGIWLGRWLGQ